MLMARKQRHWIVLDEEAKTWKEFDRILAESGIKTRIVGFRQMLRNVVKRGRLPR